MTGAELKMYRKKAGLSQHELAQRAGVHRCTVVYWERKLFVDLRGHAPRRFFKVLKLKVYPTPNTRARGWGITDYQQIKLDEKLESDLAALQARAKLRRQKLRVLCAAQTRKGRPCRLMSEPGRRRCKFHGGMSTGPKTSVGKARIADAQKRRWQEFRGGTLRLKM